MAIYRERLAGLDGISMNPEPPGTVNGAWMPTVVFEEETGISREKLQAAFAAENADARVFFWPLSSLPMFEPVIENRIAWDVPQRAINLPSFHEVTDYELSVVMDVLEKLYSKKVKSC
jgi:perosamine synthetase